MHAVLGKACSPNLFLLLAENGFPKFAIANKGLDDLLVAIRDPRVFEKQCFLCLDSSGEVMDVELPVLEDCLSCHVNPKALLLNKLFGALDRTVHISPEAFDKTVQVSADRSLRSGRRRVV